MSTTALNPTYRTKLNACRQVEAAAIANSPEMFQNTAAEANPRVVEELTLDKARELLDWLEANGVDRFNVEMEQSGQRDVWTVAYYAN